MTFLDRLNELKDNMRTTEIQEVESLLRRADRQNFVQQRTVNDQQLITALRDTINTLRRRLKQKEIQVQSLNG